VSVANLCNWHRTGVPTWAPARWYALNCVACAQKVAQGKVSPTDPSSRELVAARKLARMARAGRMEAETRGRKRWAAGFALP
jgi:hypothetical protein